MHADLVHLYSKSRFTDDKALMKHVSGINFDFILLVYDTECIITLFGLIYWVISREKFNFAQFITYQLKIYLWHIRTSSV